MTDESVDILQEAATLLADCRTASLATVDSNGQPYAANIQYVHDDRLHLYFVSSEDSGHSQHIAARPDVAVTVYHHEDAEPGTIRGLQLHGRVAAVTDEREQDSALTQYLSKFSFIADSHKLRGAVERQTIYCFAPTWLRLIDNRRGFGWKVEIEVGLQ